MQQQDQTKQYHQGQGAGDYLDPYLTEMLEVIHSQAAGGGILSSDIHACQGQKWAPRQNYMPLLPRRSTVSCPYRSHSDHGSRGISSRSQSRQVARLHGLSRFKTE
jgi:hypothetical protein